MKHLAPSAIPRSTLDADSSLASDVWIERFLRGWDREAAWLRTNLARTRPRPDEEAINDAIIAAAEILLEKRPAFENLLHVRYWMRRTCRNLLLHATRDARKFRDLDDARDTPSVDSSSDLLEYQYLMDYALGFLDGDDAELVRMHASGISITEIAETIGVKRTTLQMRLASIRKRLEKHAILFDSR